MNKAFSLDLICAELTDFIATSILAENVELTKDTTLSNLGVDSFSLIEIVLFIERKYGVVLSDETLIPENLKSIETIAKCTFQHLKA